jgi:hypothetical protein
VQKDKVIRDKQTFIADRIIYEKGFNGQTVNGIFIFDDTTSHSKWIPFTDILTVKDRYGKVLING